MICTLARAGLMYTSGRHAITGSTDRFRSALTREQTAIEPGCANADKSYGCLNVDHRLLSPRQQWQKKRRKKKEKKRITCCTSVARVPLEISTRETVFIRCGSLRSHGKQKFVRLEFCGFNRKREMWYTCRLCRRYRFKETIVSKGKRKKEKKRFFQTPAKI